MEIEKLMIGDWITLKGECHKVSYIGQFDIRDIRRAVVCDTYDGNTYLRDSVSHVPLTIDILKKNGFVASSDGCSYKLNTCEYGDWFCVYVYVFANDSCTFSLNSENCHFNKRFDRFFSVGVHELQHMLRDIGAYKFADEIKV